ncbi:hypothetical protein IRB23SM22_13790 [Alkalibacterium sp. s-m-22]|uniref:Uncharacterized protein n=1 Tax=Alkalibacterium indicireducens TaxID=398758 RepID=A0ABP3LBC5_9LACT
MKNVESAQADSTAYRYTELAMKLYSFSDVFSEESLALTKECAKIRVNR